MNKSLVFPLVELSHQVFHWQFFLLCTWAWNQIRFRIPKYLLQLCIMFFPFTCTVYCGNGLNHTTDQGRPTHEVNWSSSLQATSYWGRSISDCLIAPIAPLLPFTLWNEEKKNIQGMRLAQESERSKLHLFRWGWSGMSPRNLHGWAWIWTWVRSWCSSLTTNPSCCHRVSINGEALTVLLLAGQHQRTQHLS